MVKALNVGIIGVAVLMIILVLLQSRTGGLGSTFGGLTTGYRSKRGIEKIIFNLTIFISLVFFILSFVSFSLFS